MYPKLARLSSLSIQPAINLYLVDSFLPTILFPCIKTPNWPFRSIIRGRVRQNYFKKWLDKRRKDKKKTNLQYLLHQQTLHRQDYSTQNLDIHTNSYTIPQHKRPRHPRPKKTKKCCNLHRWKGQRFFSSH